jgi:hypothetical protein
MSWARSLLGAIVIHTTGISNTTAMKVKIKLDKYLPGEEGLSREAVEIGKFLSLNNLLIFLPLHLQKI